MYDQTTLSDSPSAISSLVSASGHTHFVAPGGQMTDLFGPGVARVSPLVQPEKEPE